MTKRRYILPDASIHKMEQIIGVYYNAHQDDGIDREQFRRVAGNTISSQEQSGSITFLTDLEVLQEGALEGTHRLTPFGMEFGAAVVQNSHEIPRYWEEAVRRSPFVMTIYRFVQKAEYVELKSLLNRIDRDAGASYDPTPQRQARNIVSVLETAGMVRLTKVGKEHRVRVPPAKNEFVAAERIHQLEALPKKRFDLSKLIELCKAINQCSAAGFGMATGTLIRVLLDHVPRVFEVHTFEQVIGSYGGDSFKRSMHRLNESGRDAYNTFIHGPLVGPQDLSVTKPLEVDIDLDRLLEAVVIEVKKTQ